MRGSLRGEVEHSPREKRFAGVDENFYICILQNV